MTMHQSTTHLVKLGPSRWALVTEYCHHGGSGCRQGYWAADAAGGWGTSSTSPEAALRQCARPVTYRTKAAALEADAEAAGVY
jgi:hypothetical protein